MDAKLKEKWVKALRSGEYKQGKGKFERDGHYCCLGVLCVVAGEPTSNDEGEGNWGFADRALGFGGRDMWLASMNDNGKSFPEIANYIEEHL